MPLSHAIYPSLRGKTVLISGGADGIGAAAVELFARQGSKVIFIDIDETLAHRTINHVTSIATDPEHPYLPPIPTPIFYHCDLTQLSTLQSVTTQILTDHGPIHILINNAAGAGAIARQPIDQVTPTSWDHNININLRHLFFLTQSVVPGMKTLGGGNIINMGSITWRIPTSGLSVYAACKAAIMGMTRTHSKELGRWNIRVNSVMPGAIATQKQIDEILTPEYRAEMWRAQSLQRDLVPMEVARVIVFLASEEASAVTGSSYVVDGGYCSDP